MNDFPSHHPFRSAKVRDQYFKFYDQKAERWPAPGEGRLVDTFSGQTFVRLIGVPTAQPLVLLPGGSANSLMWWPNIAAFSGSFQTFAVDNLYDFGRSVYRRKPQKPDDIVRWLNELFDALGLGNDIHLAGLSLGGWMSGLYALHCPKRVEKNCLDRASKHGAHDPSRVCPTGHIRPAAAAFLYQAVYHLVVQRPGIDR